MKNAAKKIHTTGRIISNREIAADLFEIAIECPSTARAAIGCAAPGQFVTARAWEETAPLLRRPFSIARISGGTLALIVKKIGPGTEILCGRKKGAAISLLGPLGRGFPPPEKGGRYLLVAGGFGIAPLLFFATRAKAAGGKILYGASARDHIPLSIEKQLTKNWKITYSTIDGSLGEKGLVTSLLTAELKKGGKPDAVYACGPAPMMKAAAAIAAKRSLRCLVSMETFMACGLGACMGCAVPVTEDGKPAYKMACREGPVFDSAEVRWGET